MLLDVFCSPSHFGENQGDSTLNIFFVHPNPVFYHKLVQVSFRRAMDLKGSLSNASLRFCIMMQELQEVLIFKYHIVLVVFNSKVGRHVS